MPNVYSGADPSTENDAATYEMGTVGQALEEITITHLRLWSPANTVARSNRQGHLWSIDGTLIQAFDMPTNLTPGWANYALGTPYAADVGEHFVISYENGGNYGVVANLLQDENLVSADGAAIFPWHDAVPVGNGRFAGNNPGTFPQSAFAGTWYAVDFVYTVAGAGDVTAPTAPALVLGAVTATTAALSWSGATDDTAVTGYKVYRNGVEIADQAGTTYTATGLDPRTDYSFFVRAYDAAGNLSPSSNLVDATTLTDAVPNLRATSERVVVAWMRQIPEFAAGNVAVGTTMPNASNSCWAGSGFVRVQVVGGSRNAYVPFKSPVLSVDCYSVLLDANGQPSSKAPWNKANRLAEAIYAATLTDSPMHNLEVDPGDNYPQANVRSVRALSEPRRVTGDVSSNMANFQFDVQADWVELE